MRTHSSVLAWRISGTGEPGGLPSLGSQRVGHNSNLAVATARLVITFLPRSKHLLILWLQSPSAVIILGSSKFGYLVYYHVLFKKLIFDLLSTFAVFVIHLFLVLSSSFFP